MSEIVLTYFEGRGKAELIRMLLCINKLKFREQYLKERSQFLGLIEAGKLQFNQVPLLEIHGMNLVQTGSIARYLAKLGGMLGDDERQAAKIDMLFEGTRDFSNFTLMIGFNPVEEVKETTRKKGFPRYLPIFNKLLQDSPNGLLVGSRISLADVGLFECLQTIVDYFGEEELKDYGKLMEFYKMFSSRSEMKEYFSTYKMKINDQAYVDECRKVLDWKA